MLSIVYDFLAQGVALVQALVSWFLERSYLGQALTVSLLLIGLALLTRIVGRVLGTSITFFVRLVLRKSGLRVGSFVPYPMRLRNVHYEFGVRRNMTPP